MIHVNDVILAGTILPSMCCIVSLTIFFLSLYTFITSGFKVSSVVAGRENGLSENNTHYLQKKSILMIVICAFFSFFTSLGVIVISTWSIGGVNPKDAYYCTTLIPKIYTNTYVFGNTALYQFLNARSECVKTAADSSAAFKNLRKLTKLLANLVPILAILAIALWGGELVEVDGKFICIDNPAWQLATTFSVLAAVISALFLALFIWPLRTHYQMMQKHQMVKSSDSETGKPLLAVIKKNLVLSCIAITSTVFSMIFLSILGTTPNVEKYALNLSVTFAQADLCVNLVCMALMTNAWLPPSLRRMKKQSPSSAVVGQTPAPSSNNEISPHNTLPNSTTSFQQ